jgi:hypothetical protein
MNKYAAFACAVLFGFIVSASAIPYQIPGPNQDISKNGTGIGGGNSNDAANNFFRLQTVLASFANNLPAPVFAGYLNFSSNIVLSDGLVGYDYAVLHYGKGPGGIGGGGGIAIYYLDGATSFTFPADGLGPNGNGGWSTLTLFKGNDVTNHISVPDGGSTVFLLGAVLSGLGMIARRFKH